MGFGPAAKSKWWCWRDNPKHTQQDKAIGCVAEFKKLLRGNDFLLKWLAAFPKSPICPSPFPPSVQQSCILFRNKKKTQALGTNEFSNCKLWVTVLFCLSVLVGLSHNLQSLLHCCSRGQLFPELHEIVQGKGLGFNNHTHPQLLTDMIIKLGMSLSHWFVFYLSLTFQSSVDSTDIILFAWASLRTCHW